MNRKQSNVPNFLPDHEPPNFGSSRRGTRTTPVGDGEGMVSRLMKRTVRVLLLTLAGKLAVPVAGIAALLVFLRWRQTSSGFDGLGLLHWAMSMVNG